MRGVTPSVWLDGRDGPGSDPFPAGETFDTVIVGAGVTGLSTATLLVAAGQRVAVVDAGRPGGLTTGRSTAKVTVLQGTSASSIESNTSAEVADAYVAANAAGRDWLIERCRQLGVECERRPARTFSTSDSGAERLERELTTLQRAGVAVVDDAAIDLPFPTTRVIGVDEQAQVDPVAFADAAVADLRRDGAVVVHDCRVLDVREAWHNPLEVVTADGVLRAHHVVVATGSPILDRGLHFGMLEASRSQVAAYVMRTPPPPEMSISVEKPTRSLRSARIGGEDVLIVSGFDYVVARSDSPREHADRLDAWARRQFDVDRCTHRWAAQDYRSVDRAPIVGAIRPDQPRVLVATGYNKWGFTNGAAAALSMSAQILGTEPPAWARALYGRWLTPSDMATAARFGASTAGELVSGYATAVARPAPRDVGEGTGVVGRDGAHIVGVCRVDGALHRVSAVCPHLGGRLRWNDEERSWDCPLHGSRFAGDGERIEGPAIRDLDRRA